MAGRGRPLARHPPPHYPGPYPPHAHPHPSVFEEEIELQRADLRRLSADNHHLLDERVALQRDVAAAREELRRLDAAAADARALNAARTRDLVDRGLRLESELLALDPIRKEAAQLRSELQKMETLRQEQLQGITKEIEKARADAKQLATLKNEAESLRQELVLARSAIEHEKKGNVHLLEQKTVMEKDMVAMAREIEKLRAELSSIDARGRAYEGGPYGMKLTSSEGGFPSYADAYGSRLGAGEKSSLYGAGAGSWAAYDASRNLHR